jgi:DNA-binding transcriptional LysR family regulator
VRLCFTRMALELAQWRMFLAVAERGSLMQAAEVLHTNQPALSRSLRRLERLLGGPLFVRSSKGLALTDLGRELREPVQRLVDQAAAVESQAQAQARRTSGILKVGAVDVFPMNAAIAQACQSLTVGDRAVVADVIGLPWLAHPRAVLDRTIDVGFTLTVDGRLPEPTKMRSRPLWDECELFALISDRHALADTDLIHPRDLADLPLHLPNKADNPDIYHLVLELLADAGVPAPRRAPSVSTLANAVAHIAAGNGWMVSTRTMARYVAAGVVARPLAVTDRHAATFVVVWHVDADPAVVGAFLERLDDALESQQVLKQ